MSIANNNTGKKSSMPVFYTRHNEKYQGTKVSLWATGIKDPQYAIFKGNIGLAEVQLWESKGPRGCFFNIKVKENSALRQIGIANPFVNSRKVNILSISLKFENNEDAEEAKRMFDLEEVIKPYTAHTGKTNYYINIYAEVSRRAISVNEDWFKSVGFETSF